MILALLVAMATALISYGAGNSGAVSIASMITGGYVFCVSFYLTRKALRAAQIYPFGNEPSGLIRNDMLEYDAVALELGELNAKQQEIDQNRKRNETRGKVLNNTILATVFSPVVFILAYLAMILIGALAAECHQS